jgi:orotate phosphoribosyltransferase
METVVDILKSVGAVLTDDHFVYTSGKHGSVYINKDALYLHTRETSEVGKLFAEKYRNTAVEIVVAPAVGGTILSQWTAYHLSLLKGTEVMSAYTEKDKGTIASASESQQIFKRGYDKVVAGKRVLVLEDLTTTGISVQKTVNAVQSAGGTVVAVCVMVNRDPEHVTSEVVGAPFSALGVLKAEAYDASACPLCARGVPVNTNIGHGKAFVAHRQT